MAGSAAFDAMPTTPSLISFCTVISEVFEDRFWKVVKKAKTTPTPPMRETMTMYIVSVENGDTGAISTVTGEFAISSPLYLRERSGRKRIVGGEKEEVWESACART